MNPGDLGDDRESKAGARCLSASIAPETLEEYAGSPLDGASVQALRSGRFADVVAHGQKQDPSSDSSPSRHDASLRTAGGRERHLAASAVGVAVCILASREENRNDVLHE